MKKIIIYPVFSLIFIFSLNLIYANKISGYVKAENKQNNRSVPLPGASVFWDNTSEGTTTDVNGFFELERSQETNILIIAFTGYENDTVEVKDDIEILNIILSGGFEIDEVTVIGNIEGQFNSSLSIEAKQIITDAGLNKLPCCNLSESFENNASVDVTYSDALTGAKQVKMLGLAGIYSQILRENMPAVRGLSANYGLSYFPGTWLQSVQISKGAAAVINGYESTTGQINIELRKPEDSERIFFNLYGNSEGKLESNLTSAFRINKKLSTMFLLHGSRLDFVHDQNKDGFADMPLTTQYNFLNRWKIEGDGKVNAQFGISFMQDNRDGGQIDFLKQKGDNGSLYGIEIDTRKFELFGKLGFLIPGKGNSSFGSTYSLSRHEQSSFFGNKHYDGVQSSIYVNMIMQTIIKTTQNNLSFGGSIVYDDYNEQYNHTDHSRREIVPGIFAQYTYVLPHKFSLIAGIRTDFHNIHGLFFTPRLHLKYELNEHHTIRSSVGKGYRTANIFAENSGIFASSRVLIIEEVFKAEEAWNYGINMTSSYTLTGKRDLVLSIDFYRTDFINQIIADINADVHEIRFYNLNGRSYSNSFQAELSFEPFKRFDISTAFRFNDVNVTMNDELTAKPFVNKFKGLISLSYATKYKKWMIDITNQFTGISPLADMSGNPPEFQFEENSPAYYILHMQLTKRFKRLDIYAGVENLGDYKQEHLIIDAENPFGDNFDASMIWGPVTGRKYYAGIRFKIQ